MYRKLPLLFVLLVVGLVSCGNSSSPGTADPSAATGTDSSLLLIRTVSVQPKEIVQGEPLTVKVEAVQEYGADSTVLFVGSDRYGRVENGILQITTSEKTPVGDVSLRIAAYKDGQMVSRTVTACVLPRRQPVYYRAEVTKVLPHAVTNYTQGLEFYKGRLIEGTGEYKMSQLQLIDFPSMNVIQRIVLPDAYFGEGITVLNGKIYQLTWFEKKMLVYDADSFTKEKEMDYPRQGWGLTNDGTQLWASDGSHYIYRLDPATLETTGTIQVYTHNGRVRHINEMEWIDGEIWANVYLEDIIVRIDPATGAVTGVIDASGLLQPGDMKPDTDVLNGIAMDPVSRKIYITGKNWPKMFEIKLEEVK